MPSLFESFHDSVDQRISMYLQDSEIFERLAKLEKFPVRILKSRLDELEKMATNS